MATDQAARWAAVGGAAPLIRRPLTIPQAGAVAAVFAILADPVRLRLLSLLASHPHGEARLVEVLGEFDVCQPTISYHLRVLRDTGLVSRERRSTCVYYRIVPSALASLAVLLDTTANTQ